ncbi:Cyanogenic beta-glucosidase (Fragment) [Linum grandiflorum]
MALAILVMMFLSSLLAGISEIEGAHDFEYGKGPSIWDRFTHRFPDRILGGGNGDIALDHYNRFKEDLARMKFMNVDAYRFSISWPRIVPRIKPFVTMYHWETPQGLEDAYGGFLNRSIVKDFEDYCDILFQEYGSKVYKWITLNEPMGNSMKSYDEGVFAPGHCSVWVNRKCELGDSAIEPYKVTHNQLLAHSAAYHLYKTKYQLGSYWQYLYPEGLRLLLEYTKETYDNPIIYITENGMSAKDNATLTLAEALNDTTRVDFYNKHLTGVWQAMNESQVDVRGYFAWSYADNFEWNEGYTVRFGLNYINYTDLTRHPKYSACWYTHFCNKTRPVSSFNYFDLDELVITTRVALGGRRALS